MKHLVSFFGSVPITSYQVCAWVPFTPFISDRMSGEADFIPSGWLVRLDGLDGLDGMDGRAGSMAAWV